MLPAVGCGAQSTPAAMWPPQARTVTVSTACVVKVIATCVDATVGAPGATAPRLPWETYATLVMVPFQIDMTRSAAGSALKLVVGWPTTGDPAELGAGIGNVPSGGPEMPAAAQTSVLPTSHPPPSTVGSTVSATPGPLPPTWRNGAWGSSR
jgi:hypothetical protein